MSTQVTAVPAAPPSVAEAHFAAEFTFETDCWDVYESLRTGADFVLLDVRSPALFAKGHVPGLWLILWKGAGVALLAAYAWAHHPSRNAHLIALVMALGALGDMVLEVNFTGGAIAFLLGHLVPTQSHCAAHVRASLRHSLG